MSLSVKEETVTLARKKLEEHFKYISPSEREEGVVILRFGVDRNRISGALTLVPTLEELPAEAKAEMLQKMVIAACKQAVKEPINR